MELRTQNVNTAFKALVDGIHTGDIPTVETTSRYGPVLAVPEVVTLVYEKPWERVLFNAGRDANPFFHLYESLWMLAGRNDVAPLEWYCQRMPEFSDDGTTFNGAYGYRWRHHVHHKIDTWGRPHEDETNIITDQLDVLVKHLAEKPDSRRAVLQMWNVEDDLLKIGIGDVRPIMNPCPSCGSNGFRRSRANPQWCEFCDGTEGGNGPADPNPPSKDVCCNLSALFACRRGVCPTCNGQWTAEKAAELDEVPPPAVCPNCTGKGWIYHYLDLTVFNRSNDLVWGMLGANAVHFSFLQEYMARRLGLEMGTYTQVTANLHVYTERWDPTAYMRDYVNRTMWSTPYPYVHMGRSYVPLIQHPEVFEKELPEFVQQWAFPAPGTWDERYWHEPFLREVVLPMCKAWHLYKGLHLDQALAVARDCKANDWGEAAEAWLQRRLEKRMGAKR